MAETIAAGFLFLWLIFIIIWLIFFVGGMLLFAFWVWMIVDVAKRDFKDKDDKILWVLVVVLAGFIGAIIYYFMVKRKDKNKG